MEHQRRRQLFSFIILAVLISVVVLAGLMLSKTNLANKITRSVNVSQPGYYSINHFVDGDTIAVNMDGQVETVRMIGIDTPETHKPNTPVQCYGEAAASYTKQLIGSNSVRLQADPINTNRDRYGRLLRYVYLPDGRMVETELIKNGYAFSYTQFPFEKKDDFNQLEMQAKDGAVGLWGKCTVVVESNGREQTAYK
jgi:endonuclease YncB( thermonuclease family)